MTPHHEPHAKPGVRSRAFVGMAGDQAMAAEVASARALGPLRRSDPAAGHEAIAANTPDSHQNCGWVDDAELPGEDDRGWWQDGLGSKM